MAMRKQWYVGVRTPRWLVFSSDTTPTERTHGHIYNAAIGPFRTKRGARFMADYGKGNPHCQTVSDAERLAKQYA